MLKHGVGYTPLRPFFQCNGLMRVLALWGLEYRWSNTYSGGLFSPIQHNPPKHAAEKMHENFYTIKLILSFKTIHVPYY